MECLKAGFSEADAGPCILDRLESTVFDVNTDINLREINTIAGCSFMP